MYTWLPLNSSADLAQLEKHISPEYGATRVARKLAAGISNAVKAVLIERNYIDKDYRSTYYHFYAKKGQRYRADCVRLHFFDGTVIFDEQTLKLASTADERLTDHYYGYMVLRPTGIVTIGRTVVSPDVRSGACRFIITANHKVHILGYKLEVQGFPSMDQHHDISVCAHAACWSILRHYSERYNVYREFLTHDITMMAHQFDPGGLIPSKGLEVSHAERVFQQAGTFPVHIPREKLVRVTFLSTVSSSHMWNQVFHYLPRCIRKDMQSQLWDTSGGPQSTRRFPECGMRGMKCSRLPLLTTTTFRICRFQSEVAHCIPERTLTLSLWLFPKKCFIRRTRSTDWRQHFSGSVLFWGSRQRMRRSSATSLRRAPHFGTLYVKRNPNLTRSF